MTPSPPVTDQEFAAFEVSWQALVSSGYSWAQAWEILSKWEPEQADAYMTRRVAELVTQIEDYLSE